MRLLRVLVLALVWLGGTPLFAASSGETLPLREGWMLRSSATLQQGGEALSRTGVPAEGWTRTTVPNTVVGALVGAGVHPDPFPGKSLRSLPGTTYPIARNFSHFPMSEDSPFKPSWWYRTEFEAPETRAGGAVWLHLDGVNYRANVWLNGHKVAGADQVVGTFRRFELEVTPHLLPGKRNALAVEVVAPEVQDLALTWVDWNPMPPDRNMGLWSDVWLSFTGPVALRHPQVVTDLDVPSLAKARLTVSALLRNALDRPVKARLHGRLENRRIAAEVSLGPREEKEVRFEPAAHPQLVLHEPRVWWPYTMGAPELYQLDLEADVDGIVSDHTSVRFGVQKVASELTDEGHRLFKINGRNILIRGAGWTSDMMLRRDPARQEAELRYVKDMNLNTVRLEGKFEDEAFFDLTDRMGILVMIGWCCCDHWEDWPKWDDEDRRVAMASQTDQIRRLRNRPSVFVWLNASDGPPPAEIEQGYLDVLEKERWPDPWLSSATDKPAAVTGKTGVKMLGPYDYIPPNYWLSDKTRGGAHGFATEIGPGPSVPPLESVKAMVGEDHLWPIDDVWRFHCGGQEFADLEIFNKALERRYGKAKDVEDYVWKAQAMSYEAKRAMFEGYRRNKYESTGVIQWMLNNSWPSMIWHLYDYYLRPGGSYFGAKKANQPVHVLYGYDGASVSVVSERLEALAGLKVSARVFDLEMKERFSDEAAVDVPADGSVRALSLPRIEGLTPTYFLRLAVHDASGRPLASNFYWLSTRPDELDWKKSEWFYTPMKSHADLTGLQRLPKVGLRVAADCGAEGREGACRVRVENPTPHLAFMTRLRVVKGSGGDEVLPALWEDNYFELLPGEAREVRVTYPAAALAGAEPLVRVDGWNVEAGAS